MPLKFTSNNIVYTHTTQLHYQIAIRNSLFTFYCLKILTVSIYGRGSWPQGGGPYVVTPPSDVTVHYISKIL